MTAKRRIGIWLIGCKGGVATTTIVGLTALKKGLVPATGPGQRAAGIRRDSTWPAWDDFVIGGHEIRRLPLCREAYRVHSEMRAASREAIDQCRDELDRIEARVRPGTIWNSGPTISALADLELPREKTPRQIVDRLQADLRQFIAAREDRSLDRGQRGLHGAARGLRTCRSAAGRS